MTSHDPLDAALFVWEAAWLGVAFHAFVLFMLYGTYLTTMRVHEVREAFGPATPP